ncbi:hypothetical protein ABZZ17_32615 [Streptomyces sp. NPDC006512]|uniref:hypothetical protein n=1 Tax=Streptomyces sp. NPDC006512 TaxID=3154307 RepID=UPI0033AB0A90
MSKPPASRHRLRLENHQGDSYTDSHGQVHQTLTGLTTVTCACGMRSDPIPSDDARLVYEQHRHLIRDEVTQHTPSPQ